MRQSRRRLTRLIKQLRAARRAGELVRVRRSIARADVVEGFVIETNEAWTLLARLDRLIMLDGFVAVRTPDIRSVRPKAGRHDFPVRALALRGQWPPNRPAGEVLLASAGTVLAGVSDVYPVVAIATERRDPSVLVIGRPIRITGKRLRLREISPRARWHHGTTAWRLADVTRVDFGGRYEQALVEYAGPPPPP